MWCELLKYAGIHNVSVAIEYGFVDFNVVVFKFSKTINGKRYGINRAYTTTDIRMLSPTAIINYLKETIDELNQFKEVTNET